MNPTSRAGAGPSQSGAGQPQTIRFPVAGMTCGSCVVRITRALKGLDGIERIKVDLRDETVTVRRDPGRASDDVVAAAIADAGYEPDLAAAQIVAENVRRGIFERWLRR